MKTRRNLSLSISILALFQCLTAFCDDITDCHGKAWSVQFNRENRSTKAEIVKGLVQIFTNNQINIYGKFAVRDADTFLLLLQYHYQPDLIDIKTGMPIPSEQEAWAKTEEMLRGLIDVPGISIQCRCYHSCNLNKL